MILMLQQTSPDHLGITMRETIEMLQSSESQIPLQTYTQSVVTQTPGKFVLNKQLDSWVPPKSLPQEISFTRDVWAQGFLFQKTLLMCLIISQTENNVPEYLTQSVKILRLR